MGKEEKICGHLIHPAASVFPLMEGEAFQRLVDSIAVHGVQNPIVSSGDYVLDGRNRLRAVHKLRDEGHKVALPSTQWKSRDGMTESQWIEAQNLDRRHLSPEAFAAAAAALNRIARKEAKERQRAGQFEKGKSGNPDGKKQARTKRTEPAKRDTKAEDARSTAGQVAAKAGVSLRKAKQAVKLDQAVEAGVVSEQVQKDVIAGKKKLRDAVKQIPQQQVRKKKRPIKRKTASALFDDLRLLLSELLDCDRCDRQKLVLELNTWIVRAQS